MKVCLFLSNFLPRQGGAEYCVHYLAKYLPTLGVEATVHASWHESARGIRDPYPVQRYRHVRGIEAEHQKPLQLAWERRRRGFDLIHAHFVYEPGWWAALYKRRYPVPLVVTSHGGDLQVIPEIGYGARLRPGVEEKVRQALEASDVIACVSERIRRAALECGADDSRIALIRNGTEFDAIERAPFIDMRERLGIGPERFVILAIGRNHPVKGIPLLLDAVALLRERIPELTCVIVSAKEEIERAAREREVGENVVGLDFVPRLEGSADERIFETPYPELVNLYRMADVFVVPSYVEAFSLSIMDAMAVGLPVVLTETTGNAEIVRSGEEGLVIPRSSVDAIVRAVGDLYESPELRRRLGAGAREVARRHDWAEIARQYAAAYERAMERAGNTARSDHGG